VTHLSPDVARLRYECAGNVDVDPLLDRTRFEVEDVFCGAVRATPRRAGRFDVAFNAICDADTNGAALRKAGALVDRLGLPTLNHPAVVAATTRDRVARSLAGVPGLAVPQTARIRPEHPQDVVPLARAAGVDLPMLVRRAGAHGGAGLIRLDDEGTDPLEAFAYDGGDLYVTPFVDCSAPDGWTRKWRVVLLGGVAHPRHLLATRDGWNVHADRRAEVEASPELMAEDRAFAAGADPFPPDLAHAVHRRLGLDYVGIDYGRDRDGRLVLFEANACARMVVGSIDRHADYWQPPLRAIADAFMALLDAKAAEGRRPASP
jgi:hypothetical protein